MMTASGEMFKPNGLTAAHDLYLSAPAFASAIRRTGRSVSVARQRSRPLHEGRFAGLSYGAARAIGMHSTQSVTMKKC